MGFESSATTGLTDLTSALCTPKDGSKIHGRKQRRKNSAPYIIERV